MKVRSIYLAVTGRCNLDCTYCYARGVEEADMTEEVARKAIDFFLTPERFDTSVDVVRIFLAGGEPFLVPDIIRFIADYASEVASRNLGKQIVMPIPTNGTLLVDSKIRDLLKYLKEKGVIGFPEPRITFLGNKYIHDKYRPFKDTGNGSFEVVEEGIKAVLTDRIPVFGKIDIVPEHSDYMYESYVYTFNFFDKVKEMLICGLGWSDKHWKKLYGQYINLINFLKEHPEKSVNLFGPFPYASVDNFVPCDAGVSQVTIDQFGDIYGCPRMFQSDRKSKFGTLGNVLRGEFLDNLKGNRDYFNNIAKKHSKNNPHHIEMCWALCRLHDPNGWISEDFINWIKIKRRVQVLYSVRKGEVKRGNEIIWKNEGKEVNEDQSLREILDNDKFILKIERGDKIWSTTILR